MSPLAQAAPYSLIPVRLSSLQNPAVACSRFGAETKVENYIKKNIPTICANWHHNGCLPEHLLGVVAHHGQGRSERNGRVCAWYNEPSHFVELARRLRDLGKGKKRMSKCHNLAFTSRYNMTRASMIVGTETFAGGPPFPASCTKRFIKKKCPRVVFFTKKRHKKKFPTSLLNGG